MSLYHDSLDKRSYTTIERLVGDVDVCIDTLDHERDHKEQVSLAIESRDVCSVDKAEESQGSASATAQYKSSSRQQRLQIICQWRKSLSDEVWKDNIQD